MFYEDNYLRFHNYALAVCIPIQMKNTHFAENRITVPLLGNVGWVMKSHIKGRKATNCSTCAILFQRIRNLSVNSEAFLSCFVTYKYNNININDINIDNYY